MQTTAIGTVANSLPENEVILLTLLISKGYILFAELFNKFRLSDDNLTNRIFLQEYGTVRRLYIRGSLSKFAFDAGRFFCNKSRFRVRESGAFRETAKPRFRAWPKFVA